MGNNFKVVGELSINVIDHLGFTGKLTFEKV